MGRIRRVIPHKKIEGRILLVRGEKVMLDSDLAQLYGAPTRRLNEQVRRTRCGHAVERAVQVNIEIMRAFVHLRAMAYTYKDLRYPVQECLRRHPGAYDSAGRGHAPDRLPTASEWERRMKPPRPAPRRQRGAAFAGGLAGHTRSARNRASASAATRLPRSVQCASWCL
jgi:ORF6N domain